MAWKGRDDGLFRRLPAVRNRLPEGQGQIVYHEQRRMACPEVAVGDTLGGVIGRHDSMAWNPEILGSGRLSASG